MWCYLSGRREWCVSSTNELKVTFNITRGRILPSGDAGGRKLPKNYQLIYEIVEESGLGRHLTPSEIYAKARRRRPGIGFSTVYRGLERLHALGLVAEVSMPGVDSAAYEPSGPRHAHFRCSKCGAIEDVAYAIPARTIKTLALRHGFNIESERVTFEGRCPDCSAA
jgi:Fe2+ or Zn2+ uptake regulation protein